ncbi:sugar ABC transporter substrate-binding protein [Glycomyces buryatensis]|uniref:Extracellular solute-binding protein n=1 Tax=Glycomyces buryatensis TaxID=2570927 RepID=A0A4S8PR12_9ACTN|nr:extracellular solute-binding protein [Glycomyces buryatensis]THV33640.1 extracellular solute-binding protein [Glycomyces buryatensis]
MRSNGAAADLALNRRRLLVLGGLTATAGTLAACGGPEEEEEATDLQWDADAQQYVMEDAIAKGEQPLKIWIEDEPLAQALIAAFNQEYPDVKVEYELVIKDEAVEKMATAGEAGNGGDVYMTFYDQLSRAIDQGVAAPMGEYDTVLKSRMNETFTGVVSGGDDGSMHAVPITTESIALFYNKTLLKELTGSEEPAKTWEEIAALAEEYNQPGSNRWTIQFTPGEIYHAYSVLSAAGWTVYPDLNPDDPGFDDPALAAALEYYAGLRELFDVPAVDATEENIRQEFSAGTVPYAINGPWAFADFDAGAEEHGYEYGVTVLPSIEGGEPASSFAGMHIAVVSTLTEYPAAARVFANFMASDAGAAALYASTGQIPAVNSDLLSGIEGLADDPHVAGIIEQSAQADLIPQVPEYFWETGNTLTVDVWDNLSTVEEAQTKALDSYNELHGL